MRTEPHRVISKKEKPHRGAVQHREKPCYIYNILRYRYLYKDEYMSRLRFIRTRVTDYTGIPVQSVSDLASIERETVSRAVNSKFGFARKLPKSPGFA